MRFQKSHNNPDSQIKFPKSLHKCEPCNTYKVHLKLLVIWTHGLCAES
jgi:hypothetical protein